VSRPTANPIGPATRAGGGGGGGPPPPPPPPPPPGGGRGRPPPDLTDPAANLDEVVDLMLAHPDHEARLRDVLIDQHVMQGVGNVYRCEVLWATELSPWAHVADLTESDVVHVVNTAASLLRTVRCVPRRPTTPAAELAVYGRNGQACRRCHDTIESRPIGRYGRMLYWCPGCQRRHDRKARRILDELTMDPHPAAAIYLDDWRRHRDAG
jgi:endonuclease-8